MTRKEICGKPIPLRKEGFLSLLADNWRQSWKKMEKAFDRVNPDRLALDQARTDASSRVTHLTYTAVKR